jgi:hypothetical protein
MGRGLTRYNHREVLIMAMKILPLILMLNSLSLGVSQVKLDIKVEEKFELLTTVQVLSDYFLVTQSNSNYKNEILKTFEPYKNHQAIQIAKIIGNDFFVFDYPIDFMLHYSFPDLNQTLPFDREDRYHTYKDTLDLFVNALRDFYKMTNFHQFYLGHKPIYDSIVSKAAAFTIDKNIPKLLEDHYGAKNHSYQLILCPLMHDGGFGPRIRTTGGYDLYAFVGPKATSNGLPEFDENKFKQFVFHEFSHSFCNPIIDKFYYRLVQDSCLADTIAVLMKKQGYGIDWKVILYEHLVRANEIFLLQTAYGDSIAHATYDNYIHARGFRYLDGLLSIINDYSKHQSTYHSEENIGLRICEYFDGLKSKYCR